MAKKTPSLLDIQRQIADLTQQANEIKAQEKSGVVERIKQAIEAYGLTRTDIFGTATRKSSKSNGTAKTSAAKTTYGDGTGNTWGGRGPRPAWLRDALATGKKLEEFAQGGQAVATAEESASAAPKAGKAATRRPGKARKVAKKVSPKYRDEAGNTWSGRGLQPRWLKAALAQGKTLQDFAV